MVVDKGANIGYFRAISTICPHWMRDGQPMQQRKQKFLDRGYQDEFGIYDTVIGDPESRSAGFEGFNPVQFQKNRFDQRRY